MKKVTVIFELSDYDYDLCFRSLNRGLKSVVFATLMRHLLHRYKINFEGHEISE